MNTNDMLHLVQELKDNMFWGSVKLTFQNGGIAHIEVTQTIKDAKPERQIVLIRESIISKFTRR